MVKNYKTCSETRSVGTLEVPVQCKWRGVEPSVQVFPPKQTDKNFEMKRESFSTKSTSQVADKSKSLISVKSTSEGSESDQDSCKSEIDVLDVLGRDWTTSANSSPSVS